MTATAMTPEQWARVEDVFCEVVEAAPGAREALLSERLGDEPELLQEVRSLLLAHERTGGLPSAEEDERFQGRYPERIHHYRIVRLLGEGGMGLVFLAIREADGFEQTVALKVIRTRFVDPLLARRFEEERRILATLEHPGIARLIDGGVTEEGEPYIAMEYVEGDSLLTVCDDRRMGLRARIALFIRVCEAVQAAHRRLVVHRDLKPSNILVTPAGDPKLLDFGVAKSLELGEGGATTRLWATPAYASPEQLDGRPLTVASDVYALGVILTELLTGAKPYETESLPLAELNKVVLERPPTRPSQLAERGPLTAETTPEELDAIAGLRGLGHGQWVRALKGDLDLIVLKALEKDPDRRYGSAERLAEDLRRYLEGRPVEARAPTVGYRVAKFLGRNRVAATASGLLVLALGVGGLATLWQARAAERARVEAEAQANRAGQVMALMTDLFRLGDPTRTVGDTIGVRQVLREGRERVQRDLADAPLVQAELLLELGRIHRNLGLIPEATELSREALNLQELHDPGSRGHADALAFRGVMAREAGEGAGAIPPLSEALEMRGRLIPAPDSTQADLLYSLAWEVRASGDYDRASELFREAAEIQEDLLGRDHPAYAHTVLGLASTFHDRGSFDEAEALLGELATPGLDGRPDPDAASALLSLGMVRRLRQQYVEAEPLVRSAREMRRQLFPPDHPTVVEADEHWGQTLGTLGRYPEARELLATTVDRSIAVLGPEHTRTRNAREGLAQMEWELGEYGVALARLDSVAEAKRVAHGGDHPGVIYTLVAAGELLAGVGDWAGARERLDSAMAMGARQGGNDGVYGAQARIALGAVAVGEGELDEGERLTRLGLSQLEGLLRPGHRYVLSTRRSLARVLLARGEPGEALDVLGSVPSFEEEVWPMAHPSRGRTSLLQAEARLALGDRDAAREHLLEADRHFEVLPPGHPLRVRVAVLGES